MTLNEAQIRAIQLINGYSNNGALISPTSGNYQDYILRMPGLANEAQMEIAKYIKIPAVKHVSQPQTPNMLGTGWDIDLLQPENGDKLYYAQGVKSFHVMVDRPCTITLEEGATILKTMVVTGISFFTTYKGNISPVSNTSVITLRVNASQPVQIKNRALFRYSYTTDSDVPTYEPYVPYIMGSDFMEFNKIVRSYDQKQLNEWSDFKKINKNTIAIRFELNGQFDIHYYRLPTEINQTTPTSYEFELDTQAELIIPYYIGAHIIMDENQTIGNLLLSEYQNKLQNLSSITELPEDRQIQTVFFM